MHTTVSPRVWILSMAIFVWLSAHGMAVSQQVVPPPLATSLAEQLRERLETVGHTAGMTIQSELIRALDSLLRFYERRSFRPVWMCEEGPLPHTEALVQIISQAEREGLRSASYH